MQNDDLNISAIAVIDTETNWKDEVMSLGIVIANSRTFYPIENGYYIVTPEYKVGGMFSSTLNLTDEYKTEIVKRERMISSIRNLMCRFGVRKIFAYNALFDKGHLPELRDFDWYDIMRLAAYKQYNPYIPACADCFKTGRLKHGYGVEDVIRMISGRNSYCEMHNALTDALDELQIMRFIDADMDLYEEKAKV